jgi:hypothetical protein
MHRVLPSPLKTGGGITRPVAAFALRLLARVALATWFGGFSFYAAVVVPDLHEHLGGMETGEISRRVAVVLYGIGATALALGWLVAATEWTPGWRGKVRFGLLGSNTMVLIALVLMHRSLGVRLDSGDDLPAFRSFHELYLTVWTGQWLAILGLLALEALPPILEKGDGFPANVSD